jgi:putative membrane protein
LGLSELLIDSYADYVVIAVWRLMQIVAICGVVGAVQVGMTREDAFRAADRQSKWVWLGLLLGSAFVSSIGLAYMAFMAIIGVVIIGIYWFDVRPQIKDILSGNYQW